MPDAANRPEIALTEEEYMQTMDRAAHEEALYDAREYLIAGLENQAEWWEHLGDAHRDYAALARALESLGLLDEVGRLHRMVDVVAERDRYRDTLESIARDALKR